MKSITIHNYKEFAIDYMVDKLSPSERQAFIDFLAEHPEIADEVLLFDTHESSDETPDFATDKLKKELIDQSITEDNFEEYCIASLEGDLDEEAQARFEDYVKASKERAQILASYQKCRLSPEEVAFPHKSQLKKNVRPVIFGIPSLSITSGVAAAILLFLFILILPKHGPENTPLVQQAPLEQEKSEKLDLLEGINKALTPAGLEEVAQAQIPLKASTSVTTTPGADQTSTPSEISGKQDTNMPFIKLQQRSAQLARPSISLGNLALATSDKPNVKAPLEASTTLMAEINNFLYTKVLNQGVESINKMAETDLGYEVVTDENGLPVKVIIKSRFGEINKTLAQR